MQTYLSAAAYNCGSFHTSYWLPHYGTSSGGHSSCHSHPLLFYDIGPTTILGESLAAFSAFVSILGVSLTVVLPCFSPQKPGYVWHPTNLGVCEVESHAVTCCLGSNFVPILYYTGKVWCYDAPFLSDLPNQEGIPICSGANTFDDGNGDTIILIFNEALWFGDQMKNSFINLNQVRVFGVSLCDDPTDSHRHLGMTIQDHLIPFTMTGSTCHFTIRTSTNWKLETCPQMEITSDMELDLNQVHFSQDTGEGSDTFESSNTASHEMRYWRPDVEPSYLAT